MTVYKPQGSGHILKMVAAWPEGIVLSGTRHGGAGLRSRCMEGGGRRIRSSGSLRLTWAPWDRTSQTKGGRRG